MLLFNFFDLLPSVYSYVIDSHAFPQPRPYKPPHSTGNEYLNRQANNSSQVHTMSSNLSSENPKSNACK